MRTYENEQKLAKDIIQGLNNMTFSKKECVKQIAREHRYLQAEFMELVLQWIELAQSDDYLTDGRNEHVKTICKKLYQALA